METKISSLLSTQNDLENRIESLKHNSQEEELKLRIETLERAERALLRKIEILQQSDSRGSVQVFYLPTCIVVCLLFLLCMSLRIKRPQ